MHAAVVEVTNKFKTQATAVFFPEPSRMDKHMRMYTKPGTHVAHMSWLPLFLLPHILGLDGYLQHFFVFQ